MSIQRLRTNKALDWNDALTLSEGQVSSVPVFEPLRPKPVRL